MINLFAKNENYIKQWQIVLCQHCILLDYYDKFLIENKLIGIGSFGMVHK